MGHKAKWEYFRAIYERYRKAGRRTKHMILDEFCQNTRYHRKYAIRLLNGPPPGQRARRAGRGRRRGLSYSHQTLSILTAVWEAAGYPWSVRLKALLPIWMPWVRKRFRVSQEIEQQLRSISPRQIDRRLRAHKGRLQRRIYGRTKPGTLLKHHIPIKTDSWGVQIPGFTEVDLVSHSGNSADGEFAHSLNVTDIHTTWTESRAVLGRSQRAGLCRAGKSICYAIGVYEFAQALESLRPNSLRPAVCRSAAPRRPPAVNSEQHRTKPHVLMRLKEAGRKP